MMDGIYPAWTAKKVAGISQRKLDYWAETEVVEPSASLASGSGSERWYSYGDLVKLRVVEDLRQAGISLQHIRKILDKLDSLGSEHPGVSDVLVTDGKRVYRRVRGQLEDVLTGQRIFHVIPIGRIHKDVGRRIRKIAQASTSGRKLRRGIRAGGSGT